MADKKHIDTTLDASRSAVETAVPPSLDYVPKVLNTSRLRHMQIGQQFGGTTVLFNATSTQESIFYIPRGQLYDFSKSFLRFDLDITTTGAATAANKLLCDRPPIESMVLKTQSGTVLMDVQEFPYYWKMTRCAVSRDDFLNNGVATFATTSQAAADQGGVLKFHNPSGRAYVAAPVFTGFAKNSNTIKIANDGKIAAPTSTNMGVLQIVSGDGNEALGARCEISFNQLVFTFLSCPKLFPATEDLELRITWSPHNKFAYRVTGLADAAAALASIDGTPADVIAVTLSNLALELAQEANRNNVDTVMAQVAQSGLKMMYPKIMRAAKVPTGAGGSIQCQQRIGANYGANLLRVFTADFLPAETRNTGYNAYNVAAVKVSEFKHRINSEDYDNERLQVGRLRDWNRVKYLLNGSWVDTAEYYGYCPSYCIQLSGQQNLVDCPREDFNVVSGFSLAQGPVDVYKEGTAVVAINTLMYAVGQENILITPSSVQPLFPGSAPAQPVMAPPGLF